MLFGQVSEVESHFTLIYNRNINYQYIFVYTYIFVIVAIN